MRLSRRSTQGKRSPGQIWAEWQDADSAGDMHRAGRLAQELIDASPDSSASWFEAGLFSKARGDWTESAARNARAVELFSPRDAKSFGGVNPAAWNLGIAATALGDWSTARRAWRAYGIDIEDGDAEIDRNFGLAPIRINPDRPSLPHQVVTDLGTTEVVWCWRRSPAHAVVASVPLPESGHRFRDVLLHDGEPKGTRLLDGREVSVFDELARLEDSGTPTWQAETLGATNDDIEALTDLVGPRGLGMDDWSGIRVMCAECSLGSPDANHSHEAVRSDTLRMGLAGSEEELRSCLDEWLDARPHVVLADLELMW